MDMQETLAAVFPAGTLGFVDPDDGGSFEINGLPAESQPVCCLVRASGNEKAAIAGTRRSHYLVKTEDFVMYFRICTASADSAYSEFVAGIAFAANEDTKAALRVEARAARVLEALC